MKVMLLSLSATCPSVIGRTTMNKNPLVLLRKKGINIQLLRVKQKFKLVINPSHLLKDKTREWIIKHQSGLCDLLQKEQYLRKLIENVIRHHNGTNEEFEEMFDHAMMKHLGLEGAIMSYKATARSQARIVSLGYNNPVFCRTCQKHILLGRESYEVNYCPYCGNK